MESVPEQPATRSATPARVFKVSSTGFRTPAPLLSGSAPAPQEFKPTHSGAASGFKVPASRLREGFWRLRNARRAGRDQAAARSACGRGGCARPCGPVTMRPGSGRMPGGCACSRSALRVGPEPGVGARSGQPRGLPLRGWGLRGGMGWRWHRSVRCPAGPVRAGSRRRPRRGRPRACPGRACPGPHARPEPQSRACPESGVGARSGQPRGLPLRGWWFASGRGLRQIRRMG